MSIVFQILAGVADQIKNFAVIFLVDITQVTRWGFCDQKSEHIMQYEFYDIIEVTHIF